MLKHLLIPLDGSKMSEAVLPVVAALAEKTRARVTLLHVIESAPPRTVHGERHLMEPDEAGSYLRDVAARSFQAVPDVKWHVHPRGTESVAEGLVFHSDEMTPDLIVMCAHGGVRLRDRLVGNLAQQVVGRSRTPVLLLRPDAEGKVPFPFARVLVPLDGQPDHEQGLGSAAELARLCAAPLLLLMVVRTRGSLSGDQAVTGALLPSATEEVLALREKQAVEYVRQCAERLQDCVLRASGRVARGDPVRLIVRASEETPADLLVLGTHGRAGTKAFWSGSLLPKILRRARASFLLVPVHHGASETH